MEWYWIVLLGLHFGFNIGVSILVSKIYSGEEGTIWQKIWRVSILLAVLFFGWIIIVYKAISQALEGDVYTEFEKEQEKNKKRYEKVGV